jgi:putative transposase
MHLHIGRVDMLHRLNNGSRMSREVHVRFCEGLGVKLPRSTHPYVKLEKGFAYFCAVIDWYTRAILSYRLSNSIDTKLVVDTLNDAIAVYGKPDIFNTDQGSQYTSDEFISILTKEDVKISMDSKGRAYDNIIIERFWRTLKYENVYLIGYSTIKEARDGIGEYINFYNYKRPHASLGYKTPMSVYKTGIQEAA